MQEQNVYSKPLILFSNFCIPLILYLEVVLLDSPLRIIVPNNLQGVETKYRLLCISVGLLLALGCFIS